MTDTVLIDSEDTDVYVQAAYVAHCIPGDLLIKRKDAVVDCKKMPSEEIAQVIIPLHVISGSDHTSGFYDHGKEKILQKVVKDPEARKFLQRVGQNLDLEDDVREDMKTFVVCKIYGEKEKNARAAKWRRMKRKSTARLPPDEDSLNHHLERTNYITYCQRNYSLKEHPSPIGQGWEVINGKLKPVRYNDTALPDELRQQESRLDNSESESSGDDDDSSEVSSDDSVFGNSTDSDD
ncbi:MAG: hypothetical protein MJA29_07055 [Candidatus Omnitrophica bacterium]|nr:hypothetical protein [Candidatus Omnitrophota bacterium]